MPDVVRLRISYGHRNVEEADATPLGPAGDGGELFRVHRPSLASALVGRDDVVVLERRRDADEWRLVRVVEFSGWRTMYAPMPAEVRDAAAYGAAYTAFRREIEAAGCIVEGIAEGERGPHEVISLPPDVPDPVVAEPYDHLLVATIGMTHAQLQAHRAARAKAQEAARVAEQAQRTRARHRQESLARLPGRVRSLAFTAAVLGAFGIAAHALAAAGPLDRQRAIALAMLGLLVPVAIAGRRESAGFYLLWLPATLLAIAANVALHPDAAGAATSRCGVAVALGVAHAIATIGPGIVLGFFSLFANSTRQLAAALLGVVVPVVLSGVAGIALALGCAHGVASVAGVGSGARMLAIGVTVFLLAGPVLVTANNAAGIMRHERWRANPRLMRGVLPSLLRDMLPMLRKVAPMIALAWALALLAGLVMR